MDSLEKFLDFFEGTGVAIDLHDKDGRFLADPLKQDYELIEKDREQMHRIRGILQKPPEKRRKKKPKKGEQEEKILRDGDGWTEEQRSNLSIAFAQRFRRTYRDSLVLAVQRKTAEGLFSIKDLSAVAQNMFPPDTTFGATDWVHDAHDRLYECIAESCLSTAKEKAMDLRVLEPDARAFFEEIGAPAEKIGDFEQIQFLVKQFHIRYGPFAQNL